MLLATKEAKNVRGIKIKNVKTNKINEIKLDGLFIAIGHDPATQLLKDQLNMDKDEVDFNYKTLTQLKLIFQVFPLLRRC